VLTEPASVLFTATSSTEVSPAARDAVDNLRGDGPSHQARDAERLAHHDDDVAAVCQLESTDPITFPR
jgi:hypothetical protein